MALVGRKDETHGDPIVTSGTAWNANCLEGRINPEKPGLNMHAERGFCKVRAQHHGTGWMSAGGQIHKNFSADAGQRHERRLYCAV
jgi:hypothetical protein